jgi:cytochrome c oxidase subunit 2
MHGDGAKAYPVVGLTWLVLIIAAGVVVVIGILLAIAVFRRRNITPLLLDEKMPLSHPVATSWITIGVAISSVLLLIALVWTAVVFADISNPPRKTAFTIEITGHQWWWQVRYMGHSSDTILSTANEIHIPTGVPVKLELKTADVIHSFWIPALSGKMDTIPNQTNTTWIEADKPGIYYGQCTEYCGVEHAKMRMLMVAQPPAEFQQWWRHSLQPATPPKADDARQGMISFVVHCGSCHTVAGTDAMGVLGPDLSHLASRKMIAAGTIPNTPAYLSGWIADPQAMKPGNLMPKLELTGPELANIRTYLETLK